VHLKIGKGKVLLNAPQYLLDNHVIEPAPDDLVSVSSCLVSLIVVWWKENNGHFLRSHY
jgi:hypothetical protein